MKELQMETKLKFNLQGNGGCYHHCENLEGGHECRAGFSMSKDGLTWVNVDECSAVYNDCEQRRVDINTPNAISLKILEDPPTRLIT